MSVLAEARWLCPKNDSPRLSVKAGTEHSIFRGYLNGLKGKAAKDILVATIYSVKLQLNTLAAGFASLLALSSHIKVSLAFTTCDKVVCYLTTFMDNLLHISKAKIIHNETRYDSIRSTNVAAEREAFVSNLGSKSDSKSNLFLKLDGESDSESNVNSNCDSNLDVDLSATPLRLRVIYIKEAKILRLRRSY
ncbi:hypothetical protein QBC46DRAFT_413459 [Diplogelasinospora grovesii]|uniref:Uncharacterized protein n=1 Tax=Diplogelasinospora grovesii TaxID=303347 RepID=A0AAN6MX63_9PEZI|nr:hypothetical protein QBC46DRAFT_413459 [Diplogelasinospora grovesii]